MSTQQASTESVAALPAPAPMALSNREEDELRKKVRADAMKQCDSVVKGTYVGAGCWGLYAEHDHLWQHRVQRLPIVLPDERSAWPGPAEGSTERFRIACGLSRAKRR